MLSDTAWIDLLDPTAEEIANACGIDLHPMALERMTERPIHEKEPRPVLRADAGYVFGVLLSPQTELDPEMGIVFDEIDVILTHERIVTVRKTNITGTAYECETVRSAASAAADGVGMALWHVIDDVAERYVQVVDSLDNYIDTLEDRVEIGMDFSRENDTSVRKQISLLRRGLLRLRRGLTPLRDATQAITINHIELPADGQPLFPHDVEVRFYEVHDKLLRATEGLDLARDLLAGVRDYHQGQIGFYQAEVNKRLTVVASLLLVPTFIVGLYGQNLQGSPEFGLSWGYWFSWMLIIVTTIGQLLWFRYKRWI